MKLRSARLEELEVPLVEPFETSFGTERRRRVLFVTLEEERGEEGIGECSAGREPLYSEESVSTARAFLVRHLLPRLAGWEFESASELAGVSERFRGNRMAKAAVDLAIRDLLARRHGLSLARSLGGRRRRVEVGVSVGIQPTVEDLVARVGRYRDRGYRRVKLKVRPGWDDRPVGAVRRAYPDLEIWVDANQAYSAEESERIREWARRERVVQVEQPFAAHALLAHAGLRRRAGFRVCLDESVVDRASLLDAVALGALDSLNVKPGRVGGLGPAVSLAQEAVRSGVPAWVGGMLETGIGRAHAVALASRPEFVLPADLSASDRYYDPDLITTPFVLGPGATLEVPKGPGIGVEVAESLWRRYRRRSRVIRL